jgi:HlyD family secretion protein
VAQPVARDELHCVENAVGRPLRFIRFEPYVLPKTSLTGDSAERVDTRVLQVIYSFNRGKLPIYVGQQMDVYIESSEHKLSEKADALRTSRP